MRHQEEGGYRQAEEALLASKERYERMANTLPVMLYDSVLEANGSSRFLYVAPKPCRDILELDPDALLKDMSLVWAIIHPDDLERFHREDLAANLAGEEFTAEIRIVTPSGRLKWLLVNSKPNPAAPGEPAVWSGYLQDITDRKQAEEALRNREAQLRTIFDTSQAGIILVDPQGTIRFANNSMAAMFGMSLEKLIGSAYLERVRPDEGQTGRELMQQLIRGEIEAVSVERHYRRADGSDFLGFLSGKRLVNPDGSLQALVGIIADVTERERLREQLNQTQKIESVGRLAGGIAHDFNNMLSVILGHAEMALRKGAPSPVLQEHLIQIRKAAEHSAEIVSQLLAFARKQTVSPRVVVLNETIEGMLKMLRRLIGEEIELAWDPDDDLWPVKIDPGQIDQILANLCINARDAVAGRGRIRIETRNQVCDAALCVGYSGYTELALGDYVLLTVSDDGCGMSKEVLQKIFDPFFTTKEPGKGTGLGLAMVYGIVKQNAGYIDVSSEPGQGSRIRIFLPRYRGKVEPDRVEESGRSGERGRETVLLVEDEPAILDVGQQLLEALGYQVLVAKSPGVAIRLAEEHSGEIHLLLTDVVMPEMNGRELAKKLLSLYPGMKRLFMSGYTADVIAHHGVIDEGVAFIQKPFSFDALAAKVREVLG